MFSKFWAMRMYGSMLRNTSLFCRLLAALRVVGVIERHTQFQFVLRGATLSFISLSFLSNCWPGWLPALHHMQNQQIYMNGLNSSRDCKRPNPYNKSLFCITHRGLLPWSNPNWYHSYFPKDPRGNTWKNRMKYMINCIWPHREWENISENSGTKHSSFNKMHKYWCCGNYNG